MRIGLFGGWSAEHGGQPLEVSGDRQRALLFRLALDPGTVVTYRAIAEDLWPDDLPENPRAALQSLVARLRPQLPEGVLESAPGGYRLNVERQDVDVVRFQDLVARATSGGPDAAALASTALALWAGEPWTPGDGYDWLARDLATDRAAALQFGGAAAVVAEPAIPAPLTVLIGRDHELAAIGVALERSRLVTLVGPGGAGKTRLAVESARRVRDARFVELAPVTDGDVWAAIHAELGRELRAITPGSPSGTLGPRERVLAALAGRELLLVLDNCEHLLDTAAAVVAELLGANPRLRILATSREPLGVPGEAFVTLGPLDDDAAAALFAERVADARGTVPGPDEQHAARRIRERLDGLPLALELAAARARSMSLDEIASGLDDRFGLLARGPRAAEARHQTLRALVDWSWNLLDDDERRMLEVVSLYPAGVAAAQADRIADAHGGVPATLDSLVDRSMLYRASGRYRALETIREYGLAHLTASGGRAQVAATRLAVLADLALEHDVLLRGPRIFDALDWFDTEDDNILAALRAGIDARDGEQVVRLTAGCAWYWVVRDRNEDALQWFREAEPFSEGLDSDQAVLVRVVAAMVHAMGDFDQEGAESEARVARELGAASAAIKAIAGTASGQHDLLEALPVLVDAMSKVGEHGSVVEVVVPDDEVLAVGPWARAMIAAVRAAMAHNRGDFELLGEASDLALQLFAANGDQWGLALSQQLRSEWLILAGRLEEALELTTRSSQTMERITSAWDLMQQQGAAVGILLRLGRHDEALALADALVSESRAKGAPRAVVLALVAATMLRVQLEDREGAEQQAALLEADLDGWPDPPLQLEAMSDLALGNVARMRGEFDRAQDLLQKAAQAAMTSGDHPIAAMVAIGVGLLALDRGSLDDARRALGIAVAMRGAPDPFDPAEARLRDALGLDATSPVPALEAGGQEAGTGLDREGAAAQLDQILRR